MKKVTLFLGLLILTSCAVQETAHNLQSIQLHDRNGFQETISSEERLSLFEKTDFTRPQGYEKVIRTYTRDDTGTAQSIITTYHENGLIKQELHCINGRARGEYKEYYDNGYPKVHATIIEGVADVSDEAKATWIFDGESKAWRENGALSAHILYAKGKLTKEALYFHENGEIEKKVPYVDGSIHGVVRQYDEAGSPLGTYMYANGLKHGVSRFVGTLEIPEFEEHYEKGKLKRGQYFDFEKQLVSQVSEGNGTRALFENGLLQSKQSISNGVVEGECEEYRNGILHASFTLKHGKKHGLETLYYDDGSPKLAMNWVNGTVQGQTKSWYPNGTVRSEVTLHENMKHGMSVSWYEDGALMHVEEYEKGILQTGKYFSKGREADPISTIEKGKGCAHLFDEKGTLIDKVNYEDGIPVEE